jgi:diketogulonate reductase-like aldo/keto reductase
LDVGALFQMGYRHIDTANGYHNELIIGEALQEAFKSKLVKRDEMFVTSKLGPAEMDPPDVLPTLQASLR